MVTFVAVHPSLHTPTKVQHGLAPPTTHPGASLKGLGTHGPVVAGGSGALSSMYMYSSEVASVDTTNTTLDRFRAHHKLKFRAGRRAPFQFATDGRGGRHFNRVGFQ